MLIKEYIRNLIISGYLAVKRQYRFCLFNKHAQSKLLQYGRKTYGINPELIDHYAGSEKPVIIGKYTSIAKNVRFITGGIHPVNWVSLFPFRINYQLEGALEDGTPTTKGKIEVGSDVWIGTSATVLSGVKIGHGAVVYAGAMVTKNVPPYAIVGGVPAKIIGYRFGEPTIGKLMEIQWWNWEEKKILQNVSLFSSNNIEDFIKKHS